MEPNTATEAATEFAIGFWTFVPILILLALVVIPFWRIWTRTGHSGLWALLMVIAPVNLILLWWLAFKQWPALREPRA